MNQADPLHGGESTSALDAPACWACGAPAPVPDPAYPGFVRCAACGLLFTPIADPGALRELYDDGYFDAYCDSGGYDADPGQRMREATIRTELITGRGITGSVLEVGCAGGYFLAALQHAGLDAVGIEPAGTIAESARTRFGVDVRTGVLGEVELPEGAFDAVCAWHVLEHIPEPCAALEQMLRLLRPGGSVLLEVPNLASVRARRDGPAWHALEPLHHVSNFTPAALRAALERAGFGDIRIETVSFLGYLPRRALLRPRTVAGLAKEARDTGHPLRADPERHELLRAVAIRPPAPAQGT